MIQTLKIAHTYPPENVFAIYIVQNKANANMVRAALKELWDIGTFKEIAAKYGLTEELFSVVTKY